MKGPSRDHEEHFLPLNYRSILLQVNVSGISRVDEKKTVIPSTTGPHKTNEGTRKRPRKQRGAFDFRRRGVSIYFLQLSLFRTVLETHRQPLTPTPPQSHRKNLLPKSPRTSSNLDHRDKR